MIKHITKLKIKFIRIIQNCGIQKISDIIKKYKIKALQIDKVK